MFAPGTKWHYSDGGPNWLAECITLAYKKDLHDLIFDPLVVLLPDVDRAKAPKEIAAAHCFVVSWFSIRSQERDRPKNPGRSEHVMASPRRRRIGARGRVGSRKIRTNTAPANPFARR
jgi:hypothetical protein